MFYLIMILLALVSPATLRLRRDRRAGKGARHRTPGLARVAPAPRPGRHLLIRPRPELDLDLHADEVAW